MKGNKADEAVESSIAPVLQAIAHAEMSATSVDNNHNTQNTCVEILKERN